MAEQKIIADAADVVPTPSEAANQMQQLMEDTASKSKELTKKSIFNDRFFDAVLFSAVKVSLCSSGRIICSFRVPPHLTDDEGNWQTGAMAALIDGLGAVTIKTVAWHVRLSVHLSISYFSTAKLNEEVEVDAKVVGDKGNGKVITVMVEIRKQGSGVMVASGKLLMLSAQPHIRHKL